VSDARATASIVTSGSPTVERTAWPAKVLHVSTTINRGGAENHLKELISGQLSRRLIVDCVYLKGDGYWRETFTRQGVAVHDLRMRYFGDIRALRDLRAFIRQSGPDIVHAHGTPAELYAAAALSTLRDKPRFVISRHEERARLFKKPGFKLVDLFLTRLADKFIAISYAVLRADVSRLPAIASKSTVIHYGYVPPTATPDREVLASRLRNEWRVPEGAILLGTLARLAPEKSLDVMIRGLAAYVARPDAVDVRLAIVGQGPLERELRALVDQLGLGDKIVWAGFREDVPVVLAAFDIFALSSSLEGFGLVLLEAMGAELPIIATRTSAIPEIVVHEATGMLFAPGSPEDFAAVIKHVAPDRELQRCLGEAGRQRLLSDFGIDAMIDRTLAVYSSLAPS